MTIFAHHDSDGVVSAYFLAHATGDWDIKFPEKFGDTSNITEDDWMVDMRPDSPDKKFTCIDHHPGHSENRKYKLIFDDKPASVITFEKFKHEIPKEKHWEVVIGASGDYQAYKVPVDIWKENKQLLELTKSWADIKYGNLKVYTLPVYMMLSSNINAYCRVGKAIDAVKLLDEIESPYDILHDDTAISYKSKIKDEFNKIISNCELIDYGVINLVLFDSKYRMSGYISSAFAEKLGRTIVALNTSTGSLSIRGDLVRFIQSLSPQDDKLFIDGHDEAAGGHCSNSNLLRKILAEI